MPPLHELDAADMSNMHRRLSRHNSGSSANSSSTTSSNLNTNTANSNSNSDSNSGSSSNKRSSRPSSKGASRRSPVPTKGKIQSMIDKFGGSDSNELSIADLERFNDNQRKEQQKQQQASLWNPEGSDYSLDHTRRGPASGNTSLNSSFNNSFNGSFNGNDSSSKVAKTSSDPVLGLDYSLDIKLCLKNKNSLSTSGPRRAKKGTKMAFANLGSVHSNASSFSSFDTSLSSIDSCDTFESATSSASKDTRRRRHPSTSRRSKASLSPVRRRSSSRSASKSRRSKSADRNAKKSTKPPSSAAAAATAASLKTAAPVAPIKSAMKQTTSSNKDTPSAKKVQFFPRVRIKRVVNRADLNLDQINRIWYSRDDFREIRRECFETIRLMNSGKLSTSTGSLIWDDSDHDDHHDDSHGDDHDSQEDDEADNGFCSRGLEYKTTGCYQQRQTAKREIRTVVFEEQDFQREQGMVDTMWIAKLSEEQSRTCVSAAIHLAKHDAREAQKCYLSPTTSSPPSAP